MTVSRWHSSSRDSLRNSGDCIERHQWRVADLCRRLCQTCRIELRKELLLAALYHDEAERVIGDLPWPARQMYPALAEAYAKAEQAVLKDAGLVFDITPEEKTILALADSLDSWRWAVQHGGDDPAWWPVLRANRQRAAELGPRVKNWFDSFCEEVEKAANEDRAEV